MGALSAPQLRCEPADLLDFFSPTVVTGFYLATPWIDWNAPLPDLLQLLPSGRPGPVPGLRPDACHLVVDQGDLEPDTGAMIDTVAALSRGVAVASARPGVLLRFTHRLIAPPLYPARQAGALRTRPSGVIRLVRETALRIIERHQVLESAMLSVQVADPVRAVALLHPMCPDLLAERSALHLRLRGHSSEEVLGRLLVGRVAVLASAHWYRLLQPAPF